MKDKASWGERLEFNEVSSNKLLRSVILQSIGVAATSACYLHRWDDAPKLDHRVQVRL
jgi:hypothetical protein